MLNNLKRYADDNAGGVGLLFSLSLLPMLGITGAALDYSRATSARAALQSAADAAALAGASAPTGQKLSVAQTVFNSNLSKIGDISASASISQPDATRVRVVATGKMAVKFFNVISPSGVALQTTATAVRGQASTPAGCFYIIDPKAKDAFEIAGKSSIDAAKCESHVKSNAATSVSVNSGAQFNQARICTKGYASIKGITGPVVQNCDAQTDPYAATMPVVTPGSCDFDNLVIAAGPATVNLGPGVYCNGVTIKGAPTVNFAPGLYTIKDGPLTFEGGILRGKDVTIYFTGCGCGGSGMFMKSQMEMYMDAPVSGKYANILMYQDPAFPTHDFAFNLEKGQRLSGLIWLPSQNVQFNSRSMGSDTDQIALVAKTTALNAPVAWRNKPMSGPAIMASVPAYLEK